MTNTMGFAPYVLIISGPTASGKTALAERLSCHLRLEIINADVGQFYAPLSIGTAKPDLSNQKAPHHLFDIIKTPRDISASEFRENVLEASQKIWARGNLPCIVGGSLFYIKSLVFPPFKNVENLPHELESFEHLKGVGLWEALRTVDPDRAAELHPNDEYRVRRALDLWLQTGMKPSLLKPTFNAPFAFRCLFLSPPEQKHDQQMLLRTRSMIDAGWIEEVEALLDSYWEPFFKKKGLIGYPEIISWIRGGKKMSDKEALIEDIYRKTRQYAKRQKLFWRSFSDQVKKSIEMPGNQFAIMQTVDAFGDSLSLEPLLEDILRDLTSLNLTVQSNKL